MRLDKFLAAALFVSRADVKKMIAKGRVRVGDEVARRPEMQVEESAPVFVDGKPVLYAKHIHIMMHKPAGLLTAARDKHAPTVCDLLPEEFLARGLSPVGRLDKDVTGLLLFTTDGELNHRLTSPKRGVEKEYIARVDGVLDESDVAAMASGLDLGDFVAKPGVLAIEGESVGRLTVTEGKFHQVKRMFEEIGKPVLQLKRLTMGGVVLDEALEEGQFRALTDEEAAALYRAANYEEAL